LHLGIKLPSVLVLASNDDEMTIPIPAILTPTDYLQVMNFADLAKNVQEVSDCLRIDICPDDRDVNTPTFYSATKSRGCFV
jgi:hypothetical protein